MKPIYDVIATIRGADFPDEWVIRGNHHDGWVEGAWDPLAGAIAELAEARAIGSLLKSGWHPKRTLVYASWDGEEPGTAPAPPSGPRRTPRSCRPRPCCI